MIDLHTHTTLSDGALTPKELINRAANYGLTALAICDHDTVAAYSPDIFEYARQQAIELIPGIEFSSSDEDGAKYHIVGLFIDINSSQLLNTISNLQEQRRGYSINVKKALLSEGFSLDEAALDDSGHSITKAHIAQCVLRSKNNRDRLMREFGGMPSMGQFIERYLLVGQKCFVPRPGRFLPEDAIRAIHEAGGLAILAHPAAYVMHGEKLEELCSRFVNLGIDGIESYNIQYDKSHGEQMVDLSREFGEFCEKNNLLQSGGSDFHTDDASIIGKFIDLGFRNHPMKIPASILDTMKAALKEKAR